MQFGASTLWCLLNRGEVIYQTESPLELDVNDQKLWWVWNVSGVSAGVLTAVGVWWVFMRSQKAALEPQLYRVFKRLTSDFLLYLQVFIRGERREEEATRNQPGMESPKKDTFIGKFNFCNLTCLLSSPLCIKTIPPYYLETKHWFFEQSISKD